ncbi:E2F/DP family winged-helix DNA-binding domain-containing protein [Spironucleus salmonicida]|uniref:E2F/DP family winged-helix DNA-binding domain-containing protein n=1 Tax=Spironucleus salmonicida TaxID=348837 RepID=V6LS50_9EUKA|nr:E2F/DP family winged-helix DNA-binding domain-containing protein [Spironucleus salmonicida]|eukprot:EST47487.1 E2F/DP family winged-helix DNA-binding domain-containing protein [Spironucleus salmonicida]
MTLSATTANILSFLNQRENLEFANKDIITQLNTTSHRMSDVLNVFSAIGIIDRHTRTYSWKRCDVLLRFSEFVQKVDSPGCSMGILEHTRTVVFLLKTGQPIDKVRRTYDVLSVLSAIGLVVKKSKAWSLVQLSYIQIQQTFPVTPLSEYDTGILDLPCISFSFDE